MEAKVKIGERLKEARQACGLTQREVSEALGFVRFTLMRWEKGERIPKEADIRVLAEIYQVSPLWILGEKVKAPPRSLNRKETARRILLKLRNPPPEGTNTWEQDWVSPLKRERAFAMLQDPNGGRETAEAPSRNQEFTSENLASIAARIQTLLSSRPILPILPGVPPEVIQAMKDGVVIPSPELMIALAEKTLVHPRWFLTGEGFSPFDTPEFSRSGE